MRRLNDPLEDMFWRVISVKNLLFLMIFLMGILPEPLFAMEISLTNEDKDWFIRGNPAINIPAYANTTNVPGAVSSGDLQKWILLIAGIAVLIVLLFILWKKSLHRRIHHHRSEGAESEKHSLAILDQDIVGIAHISIEGRFLRINRKFCDIVGYSKEEMLTRTFQEITYSEDLPTEIEQVNRLLSGSVETCSFDQRYIRKDGTLAWINLTVTLVRDESGKPMWFVMAANNITDRKNMENELRISQEKFYKIFQFSPVAICLTKQKTSMFIDANKAFEQLSGYSREELLGKTSMELNLWKYPSDRDRWTPIYLKNKYLYVPRFEIVRKSGETAVTETHFVLLQIGNDTHTISLLTDITEKARAEEALKEEEERFRSLMEQSPVAIMVLTPDGRINKINPAFQKLWGIPGEILPEFLGKYNILKDEQAVRLGLMPLVEKAFAGETGIFPPFEYDPGNTMKTLGFQKIEGRKSWVNTRFYPVKNEKGGIRNIVMMFMDITDRKKSDEQTSELITELLHSTRVGAMLELTVALAHEINHPLSSILNNAYAARRFLGNENPDLDEIREIIEDIISEDRRASDVIQKLRALMKKEEIEFSRLQINDIIDEVLWFVHSDLVINKISLSKQLAANLPAINGDRTHLQQVLLNLIINATDAMKESKAKNLHISTAHKDDQNIIICVKDSGSGIDEIHLERLFDPFYTTKKEGMGLGLSVNKRIIHTHGGEIWCENNKDGQGAGFYITLPVSMEKSL